MRKEKKDGEKRKEESLLVFSVKRTL